LPWQPIFDKFGDGVPKWIRLSQVLFTNIQWQYFFYILYKFDQDWSSNPNPKGYEAKTTPFWTRWLKSAFCTKYRGKCRTDRHHNFSAGRQMYGNYKTEINFATVEGTLL